MDNRIMFLNIGAKKINFDNNQISKKVTVSIPRKSNSCPDCQVRLVRLGTCFSCPLCGYGGCS